MISGIVTAILLASFLGITAWAWSARQRARFDEASSLPLRDEPEAARPCCGHCSCQEDRP
jgi:cytochrome c oxidase cbb3-type subunit 4